MLKLSLAFSTLVLALLTQGTDHLRAESSPAQGFVEAHTQALSAYREQDLRRATGILENAGVTALLRETPQGLTRDRHVAILNDYAGFLLATPDRYREAGPILNRVIALAPDHPLAYLHLGDLDLKEFTARGRPELLKNARARYQAYMDRLRNTYIKSVLPDRVIDVVYDPGRRDVCEFGADLFKQGREEELEWFLSAETRLGEYVKDPPTKGGRYLTDQDLLELRGRHRAWLGSNLIYQVSRVDLDNDGVDEIRLHTRVGTASCERNYFFKKNTAGDYELVTGEPWESYREEGAMCGGDSLLVIRYRGRNLLVYEGWGDHAWSAPDSLTISAVRNNTPQQLCALKRALGPMKAIRTCQESICRHVARQAPAIVKRLEPWSVTSGVENEVHPRLVELREASAEPGPPVSWRRLRVVDEVLREWTRNREGRVFLVDVDNDGTEELVFKAKGGRGSWLNYEILHADKGVYKPAKHWDNWSDIDTLIRNFSGEEEFIFERVSGKNYLVAIRRHPERRYAGRGYELKIFLVERGSVHQIGNVQTVAEWQVSVSR